MSKVIYFEDVEVGDKQSFGPLTVGRDEIIAFASEYDPQPFHLSDEAAAATHFGSLSASGWHTASLFMKMLVAEMQKTPGQQEGNLGAIGIDELRWLLPVHPGDTLRGESEIIEKKPSRSRPEMGVIKTRITVYNQNEKPVMTLIPITMLRTRPR